MSRQEYGDWQTPVELARAVLARVAKLDLPAPASVVEPTCGEGSFLVAAKVAYPRAKLRGYEINAGYAERARARVPSARVEVADFFEVPWERELARAAEPILVTGNPPWVTSATLGTLGSTNLPEKSNFKRLGGLEALTGKANFDVSEWMILRLLDALQARRATLAVLCKTAVARRVVELAAAKRWDVQPGGLWRVDVLQHFDASVDAVLFVCRTARPAAPRVDDGDSPGRAIPREWPVYASLDAGAPRSSMTIVDGALVADAASFARTAHLAGESDPEWRSGLKHDCARVMELGRDGRGWRNGLGERVSVEAEVLFPLLKSSDVANGNAEPSRAVIVTQHALGADTSVLQRTAPKAWAYLSAHHQLLRARKSRIYRGRADFAIFGVGPYSFAPWKVAISGLYKRCAFTLIGPHEGRPVMLDDTCYFLPFTTEVEARTMWTALRSPLATDFFHARIFWDAKRPIHKGLLQKLDSRALLAALQRKPARGAPKPLALRLG